MYNVKYRRLGREKLVLRHSVFHFISEFEIMRVQLRNLTPLFFLIKKIKIILYMSGYRTHKPCCSYALTALINVFKIYKINIMFHLCWQLSRRRIKTE